MSVSSVRVRESEMDTALQIKMPDLNSTVTSTTEKRMCGRLEKHYASTNQSIKKERCLQLAHNLSKLRTPQSSDVILVCRNQEFYAHKLILEASSTYFVTMFNTELEEARSGRVNFKEMDPETLEILLNFIYLGDVGKMNSERQISEVLANAHLMQLEELFSYCCSALETVISAENFADIWQIGLRYECASLTSKVMSYVQADLTKLSGKTEFLLLPFDLMQTLLEFLKDKVVSFNEVLRVVVKWLIYDPNGREKFAGELLAHIDPKLVSKFFIRSLLGDVTIMKSSVEIKNRINELGVAILLNGI